VDGATQPVANGTIGDVPEPTISMYDALFAACLRIGYDVSLEKDHRGWLIRVRDPSGAEACRTLVGDRSNLEAAATNIGLYLKPLLTLDRPRTAGEAYSSR
jgi:hypothetical protein